MKQSKFRRTLTQLLITVPAVPLLGCEPQNCDGSGIERAYNYSDILLPDGSRPTTSTPREDLQEARREALRALAAEVQEGSPTQEMIRLAGLPSREEARHLVQRLSGVVLSGALAVA